jgi:transcriptional regulator with XRE-family HTH domain
MKKSVHTDAQKSLQSLLRSLRRKAGLTQVELAKRLDTPHSRISNYKRGERRMDIVQLRDYCLAVGITLTEFIDLFEKSIDN